MNVCTYGAQFIHHEVVHKATGKQFEVKVVYVFNNPGDRLELWASLVQINRKVSGAWLVLGDFNNVSNLGGRIDSQITLHEIAHFRDCVRECLIQDHPSSGPFFTWSNKQEGESKVFSKIDRVLANDNYFNTFRVANAVFLPESSLDHCSIIIKLDVNVVQKAK